MAFRVDDFQDLVRLLGQHPEWRAELRRLVLTDEVLVLPALVRELADRVEALAAAQVRTEERLETLAAAQVRTEEQLAALAAAQARSEVWLKSLDNRVGRLEGDMRCLAGLGREG